MKSFFSDHSPQPSGWEQKQKLLLLPIQDATPEELAIADIEAARNGGLKHDSWRRSISSTLRWLGSTVIVLLAVYGVLSMSLQIYDKMHSAKPIHCYCGNSVEEAVSLGCRYDSLAAAWLPEYCRDDALTAEFETEGPGPNGTWIYWRDSKHSIEISTAEIAAGGGNGDAIFRMSWDWHKVHCMYYWRKQYRSWNGIGAKMVEPTSDSEGHILHCAEVLLKPHYGTKASPRLVT